MKKRFTLMLVILTALGTMGSAVKAARPAEKVIQVTAKKFEFTPGNITVKKGETGVLEIKSEDVKHGFNLPDFKVRAVLEPGKTATVRFTPDRAGTFTFHCDVFCGDGHEDMSGTLTVTD
jgi:cytochrome c oxidase subunit II